MSRSLLVSVLVLLGACLHPPAPLVGEFPPTTVADARGESHESERVRWGGVIVQTRPGRDETCFEIVALLLDRRARPREIDNSPGRFVACAPGFWDPAIYAQKREVTVVGTIEGTTTSKVGDYEYTFPRVAAEVVYLWPERPPEDRYYYGGYYGGPYWGPNAGVYWGGSPGPYWGPYWYPYWWGWYDPSPHFHPHQH